MVFIERLALQPKTPFAGGAIRLQKAASHQNVAERSLGWMGKRQDSCRTQQRLLRADSRSCTKLGSASVTREQSTVIEEAAWSASSNKEWLCPAVRMVRTPPRSIVPSEGSSRDVGHAVYLSQLLLQVAGECQISVN